MKKTIILSIGLFFLLSCELINPGDLVVLADKTPPEISIQSHTNNQETGGALTLWGIAEDKESGIGRVSVLIDEQYYDAAINGNIWTYSTFLSNAGSFAIKVIAYDNNKNNTSADILLSRVYIPSVTLTNHGIYEVITNYPVLLNGYAYIDFPQKIKRINISTNGSLSYTLVNNPDTNIVPWSFTMSGVVFGTNEVVLEAESLYGYSSGPVAYYFIFPRQPATIQIIIPTDYSRCPVLPIPVYGSASIPIPARLDKIQLSTNGSPFFTALSNIGTNYIDWSYCLSNAQFGINSVLARVIADNNVTNTSAVTYYVYGTWLTNKIIASDGVSGDKFGESVAQSADGKTVLIGAGYADIFLTEDNWGAVYLLCLSNAIWYTNKIFPDTGYGNENDNFGHSVAISADGKTFVSGAYMDNVLTNGCAGSVYWFRLTNGQWFTNKLVAYDGGVNAKFGYSVAISADGNTFVASAVNDDIGGKLYTGSVYWFRFTNGQWITNKFIPYDGADYDEFGNSVALSADGNTVLVGAHLHDFAGLEAGAAYWYRLENGHWITNKFMGSDTLANDNYGRSVALSGDGYTVLIGADMDEDNGFYSGSVYRYQWNGGSWDEMKFLPFDCDHNDHFGQVVCSSYDGNTFFTGAPFNNMGYVYEFSLIEGAWTTNKFETEDGVLGDYFGGSVDCSWDGSSFISGACGVGDDQGSAYYFEWK